MTNVRPPSPLALPCLVVAALAALAGSSRSTSAQVPETHPLRVEDVFRIQRVSDPVVSPNGRLVAYVVSTEDLENDSGRSDVWMLELTGDPAPRRMTGGQESATSPAFSPDGRYLSFLASRGEDASRQVWAMDLRGGEARPLTELDRPVQDYAWAPDANRLALLLRDEEPEREEADRRPPWVIDRLQFKRDYRGYLDRRRSHVYVLDLDSADPIPITTGDYDDGSIRWSPDGSRIAFVSNRTEEPDANYDTDVWIVDVPRVPPDRTSSRGPNTVPSGDSGALPATIPDPVAVSPGLGSDDSPVWSHDGSMLAWLTNLRPEIGGYAMSHLAMAAPGGEPRILTEDLDRSVGSPRFDERDQHILVLLESEGAQSLVTVPVEGDGPETLWGGARRVEAFAPIPGGGVVAQASTADRPSELWLVEPDGSVRRLTHHNDELRAELELGRVVKQRVTAPDGTELDAFYTFPPGVEPPQESGVPAAEPDRPDSPDPPADARLPLPTILWIHGGPMGQDSWGWHGLRHLFAAHGYLVVQPNYRGSHGYGQDFALGLWQDWGGPERVDAVAAVDHAIRRGWADSTKLGVGGWSYGGITTNAVITHTDRFGAAVSGAGAALHVASWGHDQYQRWYLQELGAPWENRELWERLSTFNRVEHITTPTMWIGGERDWNVPILQSEIMYQSMRKLGRETVLVVYPGQSHGGFPPVYEADRYRRFLGWFGRYLGEDDDMWPGAWPDALRR